jgi:hypothetical protein
LNLLLKSHIKKRICDLMIKYSLSYDFFNKVFKSIYFTFIIRIFNFQIGYLSFILLFMSPDLKSVDNQDISNHRPKTIHTSQKILTTSLFFDGFFSPNYMEINLKRMDVTKDFVLGLYQSPVLLNGHQFFSSSYKSKIIPRRIISNY